MCEFTVCNTFFVLSLWLCRARPLNLAGNTSTTLTASATFRDGYHDNASSFLGDNLMKIRTRSRLHSNTLTYQSVRRQVFLVHLGHRQALAVQFTVL